MNVYEEVTEFYESYSGEKRIIGRSAEERNLYALFSGTSASPVGISQYAIHGREWITALLALLHLKQPPSRGGVWILPLVNPDGALLSETGISSVSARWRRDLLLRINGGEDFSLWKANAEGVDLNVNFDARWGTGRSNLRRPAPENYIGDKPFCAPESLALKDFTYLVRPDYTISWHTKGEEIYWNFHQPFFRALRDKRLAGLLRRSTGYPLGEAKSSAGGYKDWCVEKLRIPAFTVEAGAESLAHPLNRDHLDEIAERCRNALCDFNQGF